MYDIGFLCWLDVGLLVGLSLLSFIISLCNRNSCKAKKERQK